MTSWERDLTALELWHRSFEGSRRRRTAVPRLRRQAARRKGASTAVAAAMFAGPAAQAAAAPGSRSASAHAAVASDERVDRPSTRPNRPQYVLLQVGMIGKAVAEVQRRLGVEDDGYYGPRTEHAVSVFQGNRGLEVDGVVGPETWRALFGGERKAASFAVRRATENELAQVDLDSDALPRPRDRSAAVAAIELRLPARESREKSSRSAVEQESPNTSGEKRETRSASRNRQTRRRERRSTDSRPARASATQPQKASTATASGSCGETLKWPTTATNVSSGYRTSRRLSHAGVDIDGGLNDEGNPVYAAACGVITLMQGSSESGGYGNFVCVKHTDRFVTCYAHLSRFASVSTGDYVHRGDVIGAVGDTGHSFGAHLHFETRRGTPNRDADDSDFDPIPYLNGVPMPGDPVTPSGGVGGPDLREPEPEPERSALALRPRDAGLAQPAGSGADRRMADGMDEAIDALEGTQASPSGLGAQTLATAKSSGASEIESTQGEVGRDERTAGPSTRQVRSEEASRARSDDLDPDAHLPRSGSASYAPEARSTEATTGAASGGQNGAADEDEAGPADWQERGGSGYFVSGASNRDEGKASLQDGPGSWARGRDGATGRAGADSKFGDGHATASPNADPTAADTPGESPLDEAVDEQSIGNEAESVAPEETHSGGAQVMHDTGDSTGTAGEHTGGLPGATDPGRGHGLENRPADRSASRPGNGSQHVGETMEESSRGTSRESDRDASTWSDDPGQASPQPAL